jgi:hypothetical protein
MTQLSRVIVPLRILLVMLFIGLLVAQIMSIPGEFRQMAEEAPETGALPWVLMTFGIVEMACLQVVIACTWRLLTLVTADRIFSPESHVWVDVMVATLVVGWALMFGVFSSVAAYIYFTPELRDPGTPILLFGIGLITTVVVLTVIVLRTLLRQATALRTELEDVI